MRCNTQGKDDRLFSLDCLKAISIISVVSFHSIFVPKSTYTSSLYLTDIIFAPLRFCVPVLFTISFLLLERSLEKHGYENIFGVIKQRFIRVLIPTLFWISIAIIIKAKTITWFQEIIISIFKGTIFPGAYYLLVLLQFIVIFPWIRNWFNCFKNIFSIILIQCVFFLVIDISLSNGYLPEFILILRQLSRSLFAYWISYIALGIFFYNNWAAIVEISRCIPRLLKIIMLFVTACIMIAEASWLRSVSGDSIQPFEYAMFSCVFSVLVMFLCFASITEEELPRHLSKVVKLLSKYSLGVFCIHAVIYTIFSSICEDFIQNLNFDLIEIISIKFFSCVLLILVSLYLSIIIEKIGVKACVR